MDDELCGDSGNSKSLIPPSTFGARLNNTNKKIDKITILFIFIFCLDDCLFALHSSKSFGIPETSHSFVLSSEQKMKLITYYL